MLRNFIKLIAAIVLFSGVMVNHAGADIVTSNPNPGTLSTGETYTFSGDVTTETGDGAGQDLRTTSGSGGTITLVFDAPVDLSFFNSEINQGNNFDGQVGGPSVTLGADDDAGTWSYIPGDLDLSSVVGGLGTNSTTIGNARIFPAGPGVAGSGAPISNADWGTFSIQGITTLTYSFSDDTNFEGFRIEAVSAVPEPSSLSVLGLVGLIGLSRRKRS